MTFDELFADHHLTPEERQQLVVCTMNDDTRLWSALEGLADHPIPPMTDPLGRHWRQPPREEILVDEAHAVMSASTFKALSEYSTTRPSGVYPGKMWRAYPGYYDHDGRWVQGPTWYLRWYGIVPGRTDVCSNNQREILLCQ